MNKTARAEVYAGKDTSFLTRPPWEMVWPASRAARAKRYILAAVRKIEEEALRRAVWEMLAAGAGKSLDGRLKTGAAMSVPQGASHGAAMNATNGGGGIRLLEEPAFLARTEGDSLMAAVAARLRRPLPYDPLLAAPAAGRKSHHCYPGGWALHTALNLRAVHSLSRAAASCKGAPVQQDYLLAAMLLHDWAKLKLLFWHEDHELDDELGSAHHLVALAEGMVRGLPPPVIKLLAGVHNGWWRRPEGVVENLEAAARLAGIDAERQGYLQADRYTAGVEGWIAHQAEASWYTCTKNAYQEIMGYIRSWHEKRALPYTPARWSHAVFAFFDEFNLLSVLAAGGEEALFAFLDDWWHNTLGER